MRAPRLEGDSIPSMATTVEGGGEERQSGRPSPLAFPTTYSLALYRRPVLAGVHCGGAAAGRWLAPSSRQLPAHRPLATSLAELRAL